MKKTQLKIGDRIVILKPMYGVVPRGIRGECTHYDKNTRQWTISLDDTVMHKGRDYGQRWHVFREQIDLVRRQYDFY